MGSIVKDEDMQPDFPIEKVKSKPITPMVNFNNRQSSWTNLRVKLLVHLINYDSKLNEENFH